MSLELESSLYIIRGVINGAMCYVYKNGEEYIAKATGAKASAAMLFFSRDEADRALEQMRHGVAKKMKIIKLTKRNETLSKE